MMKTETFNIDVLATHKSFFLLDKLPKHSTEVDVWKHTPVGYESVDDVTVFTMADGSLVAGVKHPFQKMLFHNLVVFADGHTQIMNMYPFERILEIYDKPIDSDSGTFTFTDSVVVNGNDWRCDTGIYGPRPFSGEVDGAVIGQVEEIVYYEPFLSVAGIGHLMYLEAKGKSEFAEYKLNNSVVPTTGRTFQEVLRLVYEWSCLADEPFNSEERVSVAAKQFMSAMRFSDDELETISNLPEMQVSKFLRGSETARTRPDNLEPMSDAVKDILFSRISFGCLSSIVDRNPGLWDFDEVLSREIEELEKGILRFRDYYGIPDYVELSETERVSDFAGINAPKQGSYVLNQLRHFGNKSIVLNSFGVTKGV